MPLEQLLQQVVNAISLGAIYALFALGYALVLSVLGVLNLAHSAVFAWGAILGLIALQLWGLPLWAAFIVATLGSGIIGVVLERVAFYPLRKRGAERLAQLISSIGAAILLVNIGQLLMTELFGNTLAYYPQDTLTSAQFSAWEAQIFDATGVRVSVVRLLISVLALGLMIGLQWLVTQTELGRAMRAVSFSERTARLLGVDTERVFGFTFFLASALGGAAGMLFGIVFTNVTPFMGEQVSLVGLVAIVLGGIGSINGAVLGGFLVAGLQTFSIAQGGGSYRNTIIFVLLFLALLIRPQGLLGQARQDKL
ncbi:MAG: branched-chain amino acid ABC transporter permease [Phototrophicaceae bacterium]